MRKLIPLILALVACAGGAGTGYVLRPVPKAAAMADHAPDTAAQGDAEAGHDAAPADGADGEEHAENLPEYVKLNNQFVVPVLENGSVAAMVIMSLSLEVKPGSTETVFGREPKLRDVFLQVLFDHANAGGFRGTFTDGANLVVLRKALLEVARRTLGDLVIDVLIVDMARQDS